MVNETLNSPTFALPKIPKLFVVTVEVNALVAAPRAFTEIAPPEPILILSNSVLIRVETSATPALDAVACTVNE